MGVLYDYFVAPSDAEAAATIDRAGGPGQPASPASRTRTRGLFRHRQQEPAPIGDGQSYPTVADTGIDPAVQGGTLEELLTGRPYDEIEQDPRWGKSLAVRDGGERLVLTLTDSLIDALARMRTTSSWPPLQSPGRRLRSSGGRATLRNSPPYCTICRR